MNEIGGYHKENDEGGERAARLQALRDAAGEVVRKSVEEGDVEDYSPLSTETVNDFSRTIQQLTFNPTIEGERRVVWESSDLPEHEMGDPRYVEAAGSGVSLLIEHAPLGDPAAQERWQRGYVTDSFPGDQRGLASVEVRYYQKEAGQDWPSTSGAAQYILSSDATGRVFAVLESTEYNDQVGGSTLTEWREPSDQQVQRLTTLIQDFAEMDL